MRLGAEFITYNGFAVSNLPDAQALIFTNTPNASLAGFELWEEYDVNKNWTAFANMSYTEGTDDSLGAPLPGMSPLSSTLGLRVHDSDKGRRWGVETSVQVVAKQTRLGEISEGGVATQVETPTAAFGVCNLRGYYNYTKDISFMAGIDNLTNTNYQTALDIRYPAISGQYSPLHVWEPGISPFVGMKCKF